VLVRQGKGGKRREVGMDDRGVPAASALAGPASRDAGRNSVLPDRRPDTRTAMDTHRRAQSPPAGGDEGRCAPTLRAASASSRARRRDGTRGRAAEGDPAPAWPRQSRCHLCLSRRDRHGRDHRHGAQPAATHDLRQRRTADLKGTDPPPRRTLALAWGRGTLLAGGKGSRWKRGKPRLAGKRPSRISWVRGVVRLVDQAGVTPSTVSRKTAVSAYTRPRVNLPSLNS
jgi:hypothetical protein